MPFKVYQHAFNCGVVDADKLHRVDLDRMRLAAEEQTNWQCNSIGRMYLRPGGGYLATAPGKCRIIPFVAAFSQANMLELSDTLLRVYGPDDALVSRVAVTSTIAANFAGWTFAATSGQTSAVVSNRLQLSARAKGARAQAKLNVSTLSPGIEHALRVVVSNGPVVFRVGTADGLDDLVEETSLLTGVHSLAFVPGGSYWVQFSNELPIIKEVQSIAVEGVGVMTLPTIWPVSALWIMRRTISEDVMFCAAYGYKQQRIERRGDGASIGRSWSVCDYNADDGPFLVAASSTAYLTPGALQGNTTLTSSLPFFKPGHVGALFRLSHDGQSVDNYLAAENQYTDTIQVTGVNEPDYNDRFFVYTTTGTWSGTLRNQRSFDPAGLTQFHDYRDKQSSANVDLTSNVGPYTNDDNEDNSIAYYRIGFPPALYTSGEAHIVVSYNGGGGSGICRVTAYNSATSVNIEVLTAFKGTGPTQDWLEGEWSGVQGYPGAVTLHQGRLAFVGTDAFDESVSDAFDSFDIDFVGDAGPIDRSIALGGRNEGRWLLPLSALLIGCDGRLAYARASSLDETITPTNLAIRNVGPVGAAAVDPAELTDNRAVFVEQSGGALYEITYDIYKALFQATEFSKLNQELFSGGITELTVQNRPDQRIHVVLANGDAVSIVFEPDQEVTAFIPISTSADTDFIESQCVLPGNGQFQDRLYRSVQRLVNGSVVRTVEKVALESEAFIGDICKVMDAHVVFGAGSATISLPHLIGRTVVAWVDGAPVIDPTITDPTLDNAKQFVVDGAGHITLPSIPAVGGCVGLGYTARYKSARLAYGASADSTPVLEYMDVSTLGLLLADYIRSGLKFGGEFDNPNHPLSSLPLMLESGLPAQEVNAGVAPDQISLPVDSMTQLDSRLCLEAKSPKPASVLAMVLGLDRKS